MLRTAGLLLVACATVMLAPSPALAGGSPVFADFQRFCLAQVGDVDATAAAAKAAGYRSYDAGSGDLSDAQTFLDDTGGVRRLVSIKRTVESLGPPPMQAEQVICAAGQNVPDPDMTREAEQWAGVPEDIAHSQSGARAFSLVVTDDGGRRDLSKASNDEIAAAIKAGGVWLLLVSDGDTPTLVLVYLRALKAP